jgi:ribosomal-protein-alanine N-acetyltransferase
MSGSDGDALASGRNELNDRQIGITRVASREDLLTRSLQQLADACAMEAPFSVEQELSRPWARLWAAHGASPERAFGLLLAWHVADEIQLLNLLTAPSMRRLGVARALIDALMAYAIVSRIRIIVLEVRRSNRPAIELYRSFGFSVLSVRPAYYSDDNEDALEMMLGLSPETGKP